MDIKRRVRQLEKMIAPAPGFLVFCGEGRAGPRKKMERYFKEHTQVDPGSTMNILLIDSFAK